jgi:hypothetical protein
MTTFSMTERQLDTLRAAADRIIPPDETCGAANAGTAEFILRLLRDDLSGEQETYLKGLDGIDREADARYGRAFAALTAEEQDTVLKGIEADCVMAAWSISPRKFFQMLVEHVLEGFYADPGNGGNRDAVSWKMIGYRTEGGMW